MFSMMKFCNYLRGVESKNLEPRSNKSLVEKLLNFSLFFRHFFKLLKILFPKFKCVSTLLFLVLLVDVVALEYVVYQVGLLSGKYFKALSNKNIGDFRDLAFFSVGIIIINSGMKSFKDFIAKMLQIVWRKYLTMELHKLYFSHKNFYYLQNSYPDKKHVPKESSPVSVISNSLSSANLVNSTINRNNRRNNEPLSDSESIINMNRTVHSNENSSNSNSNSETQTKGLDNIDQRITQDVNSLCDSFSSIIPTIIISPFGIGINCIFSFALNSTN
jgi:ABC-type uncharacterized transport system fused permease/ATPase subunit